jgi:truncated hemoglobin YjbI
VRLASNAPEWLREMLQAARELAAVPEQQRIALHKKLWESP